MVFSSNPRRHRNGDQFYPYRQHSDYFYLTGIFQQGSLLIISVRAETLFIRKPDSKTQLWSGSLLTKEKASTLSGIEDVRWLDEVDIFLEKEVLFARKLFLSQNPDHRIYERIAALYPLLERNSPESLMMQLRMIKEPEEIEEIRKACALTRSAFFKVVTVP